MDNSTLDPMLIQQMLEMQDPENDPAMQRMARQQKMVDSMRGSAIQNSQGRMVGDHFVAPNAITQVMNALTMAGGMRREGQMDQQMASMNKTRAATKGKYMDALVKAMRARGTNPTDPMNPQPLPLGDDDFETDPAMGP